MYMHVHVRTRVCAHACIKIDEWWFEMIKRYLLSYKKYKCSSTPFWGEGRREIERKRKGIGRKL